jgi:hypothetical protein
VPPIDSSAAPSDRVRAALLAREAALAEPGVVDLDAGIAGRFATVGGGTRVAGVTAAAAPGGGYDVAVRLVCEMVKLHPLADRVRTAIEAEAEFRKLSLASLDIEIVDVVESRTAAT